MRHLYENNVVLNNINSPFTDIFSILTKYEKSVNNKSKVAYSSAQVSRLRHHMCNSIDVMLRGLQGLGNVLAVTDQNSLQDASINDIGQFISGICNLIEALHRSHNEMMP